MGGKKKLQHFEEMDTFDHVFQPIAHDQLTEAYYMRGLWRKNFFKNNNPVILELGCGKGEYSVGMGEKYNGNNYLGIDIKGARIWFGAKQVLEKDMPNVGFIRTRIDFIHRFFEKDEVDEIWITFPDPQKEGRREKKRLTCQGFLDKYKTFLKKDGIIHLKTDSAFLYEYTLEVIKEQGHELIQESSDLYGELIDDLDLDTQEILNIKTHYEGIFTAKGMVITYIKFRLKH